MNNIGVFGIGVMGSAIAKNLLSHGYSVSVYNIDNEVTKKFIYSNDKAYGCYSLIDFINSLEKPRVILLMITAGNPVDQVIEELIPLLSKGDIIIDGGNSYYLDTERRQNELEKEGIYFIGCGVSGGEYGAEHGPCLMPSGNEEAYNYVSKMLCDIAAKTITGDPCCEYIGEGGSGHFVKMVHNSIEYAEMQLIADLYNIYRSKDNSDTEIISTFENINKGILESYLLEITINILKKSLIENDLLHKISDVARQKGTGKWAAEVSLEYNVPIPSLLAAVETRFISELKDDRINLSKSISHEKVCLENYEINIRNALIASRLSVNSQGFYLISVVSKKKQYRINLWKIAKIWQKGCIISSNLLDLISDVYKQYDGILIGDSKISEMIKESDPDLRKLCAYTINADLYTPIINSSFSYLNALTTPRLSTYVIQAQRDYFGAHQYERIDIPGKFHTNWQN